MKLQKIKKYLAGTLAAILITSMISTSAVASASTTASTTTDTTTQTTQDQSTSATPPGDAPTGEAPSGAPPSGEVPSGGGGGANTMTYDYSGTLSGTLTADAEAVTSDQEAYSTSTADQNTALVQNGGTLTLTNATLEKSGDDSDGDNCNFYGINSILLAVNSGSTAYISDSSLTADSMRSNGIFATDSGTVYANNDTITTTSDNSRGLDATYSGTIIANALTISTQGQHSASIATDRGGGSISVTNSTLSTNGSGSPLLYSTGDIEVNNVTGTASGAQIAGMEGMNTILIYNSELTSTNTTTTGSDPIANGVIIYQSTSGDAESSTGETATFEAANSTLTSAIEGGTMFYCTNTTANIVLSNTVLEFDSSKANLLTVQGNDSNNWGTAGSNGATVTFTGLKETLSGNINVDTISTLDLFLLDGTTYTGATTISENAVNTSQSAAPLTVNLDSTSTWMVTGDSTVTNLNVEDGATIVDADGNTVSIIAAGTTVVSGTSSYTITVTGAYSDSVSTDSSNQLSTTFIDRTAFDEYYALSTSFGTTSSDTSAADSTTAVTTTENSSSTETTTEAATTDTTVNSTTQNDTASTANEAGNHTGTILLMAGAVILLGGGAFIGFRKKKR